MDGHCAGHRLDGDPGRDSRCRRDHRDPDVQIGRYSADARYGSHDNSADALAGRQLVAAATGSFAKWPAHHVVGTAVVAIFVIAKIVAVKALGPARPTLAVVALLELLAVRHDDAVVMLGMLQIVFSQHRIARGCGIACERQIFLGDMCRCAAHFHIRAIQLEAAR